MERRIPGSKHRICGSIANYRTRGWITSRRGRQRHLAVPIRPEKALWRSIVGAYLSALSISVCDKQPRAFIWRNIARTWAVLRTGGPPGP